MNVTGTATGFVAGTVDELMRYMSEIWFDARPLFYGVSVAPQRREISARTGPRSGPGLVITIFRFEPVATGSTVTITQSMPECTVLLSAVARKKLGRNALEIFEQFKGEIDGQRNNNRPA